MSILVIFTYPIRRVVSITNRRHPQRETLNRLEILTQESLGSKQQSIEKPSRL